MVQIRGYSEHVREGVRRFLHDERPGITVKVLRDGDMASPLRPVRGWRCDRCGWEMRGSKLFDIFADRLKENLDRRGEEMPRGTLPSDMLEAIEIRHAWDMATRSTYCGGKMEAV